MSTFNAAIERRKGIIVTVQIARYCVQEQGESAEFTGVNEHFQRGYWTQ
jgi:hypothetical protein